MTWFGVPVPPWKPKKMSSKNMTLTFVITGKMPSKKNNQQSTTVRKEAYDFIYEIPEGNYSAAEVKKWAKKAVRLVRSKVIPNHEYKAFVELQRPVIEQQAAHWSERLREKGLMFPLTKAKVNIRFYFAQKHRQDTMNKAQTILDLLVLCRVLSDDDYTVTDPKAEGQLYKDEIVENICEIKITF